MDHPGAAGGLWGWWFHSRLLKKNPNGVSGLFWPAKQHCAAASQGTQKSPHREEQKTAAEHDDQQAAQVQPSPSAKSIAAAAIAAV